MPVYMMPMGAHDRELEKRYVSFLERRGLVNWHILSDLKPGSVKYNNWMKGIKRVKSAPKKSKVSKI